MKCKREELLTKPTKNNIFRSPLKSMEYIHSISNSIGTNPMTQVKIYLSQFYLFC